MADAWTKCGHEGCTNQSSICRACYKLANGECEEHRSAKRVRIGRYIYCTKDECSKMARCGKCDEPTVTTTVCISSDNGGYSCPGRCNKTTDLCAECSDWKPKFGAKSHVLLCPECHVVYLGSRACGNCNEIAGDVDTRYTCKCCGVKGCARCDPKYAKVNDVSYGSPDYFCGPCRKGSSAKSIENEYKAKGWFRCELHSSIEHLVTVHPYIVYSVYPSPDNKRSILRFELMDKYKKTTHRFCDVRPHEIVFIDKYITDHPEKHVTYDGKSYTYPFTRTVEYIFQTLLGDVLLVTDDPHAKGYYGYQLFVGDGITMEEHKILNFDRWKDGGTTFIDTDVGKLFSPSAYDRKDKMPTWKGEEIKELNKSNYTMTFPPGGPVVITELL
jgi:hypothetical protein